MTSRTPAAFYTDTSSRVISVLRYLYLHGGRYALVLTRSFAGTARQGLVPLAALYVS